MRPAAVSIAVAVLLSPTTRADLFEYLARSEPDFRWEKRGQSELPDGTLWELHMISQTWQDRPWEHAVQIFRPKNLHYPRTAILLITGGSPREGRSGFGQLIANAAGAPLAVLYNIPNQPLFDGLREDDLIAHTFVKTLETGDLSWPLLFPMTKAAVKAMNVVQEFSRQEWKDPIEGFVVTGASKRGWTTWLTAAADARVRGIAPMVYDNLNVAAQMPHQLATWGRYSEQIEPYTVRGLQAKLNTPEGAALGRMVDPFRYRARIQQPKLIINGTNDRYWTLDALNFYWDDLEGEKHLLYVPNTGHSIRDERMRAAFTITAFFRHIAGGLPFPKLTWRHEVLEGALRLRARADTPPKEALLWAARSDSRDFRQAHWESSPLLREEDDWVGAAAIPESGWVAVFGEFVFDQNGPPFFLSTQVQIQGGKP